MTGPVRPAASPLPTPRPIRSSVEHLDRRPGHRSGTGRSAPDAVPTTAPGPPLLALQRIVGNSALARKNARGTGRAPVVQRAVAVEVERGTALDFPRGYDEEEGNHVVHAPRLPGQPSTADGPVHISIDSFNTNFITEIQTDPMAALEGEGHRPARDAVFDSLHTVDERLRRADHGQRLGQIFSHGDGYQVKAGFEDATVVPAAADAQGRPTMSPNHKYVQYNVGVPLSGGYRMLEAAQQGVTEGALSNATFEFARRNNHNAMAFADRVAAEFAGVREPLDLSSDHLAEPVYDQRLADHLEARRPAGPQDAEHERDVHDLRGFIAILASQATSVVANSLLRGPRYAHTLTKNSTLVVSRQQPSALRRGLSRRVQTWLDQNAPRIRHEFEYRLRATFPEDVAHSGLGNRIGDLVGELFTLGPDDKDLDFSAADYLDAGLRPRQPRALNSTQQNTLGVHTELADLDHSRGRQRPSLAVLEFRLYGKRGDFHDTLSTDQIKANLDVLVGESRAADREATQGHPERSRTLPTGPVTIAMIPRAVAKTGPFLIGHEQQDAVVRLGERIAKRALQLKTMRSGRLGVSITGFGDSGYSLTPGTAAEKLGMQRATAVERILKTSIEATLVESQASGSDAALRIADFVIAVDSAGRPTDSRSPDRVDIQVYEDLTGKNLARPPGLEPGPR